MTAIEGQIASAIERIEREGVLAPLPPRLLEAEAIARTIDHTLLKPDATAAQIRRLCEEAQQYGFASVCVNPIWASLCAEILAGSQVRTCVVCGFPLGATLPAVKAYEARQSVSLGAAEVDVVISIGKLKDGDYRLVLEDIAGVADECHEGGALLKVIIETVLLTRDEKIAGCIISQEAGADFVKTSTGFSTGGATLEDVALMRQVVGPQMGVKAAGGVRSAQDAMAMIAAGATRIGTSGGVGILRALLDETAHAAAPGDSY